MGLGQRRSVRDADRERWMLQPRARWFALGLAVWTCIFLLLVVIQPLLTGSWSWTDWFWLGAGVFWMMYATYFWFAGSTGTTVDQQGLILRDRWNVTRLTWDDVREIRADRDDRWASHLLAILLDEREVVLPGVPVDDLEALSSWAHKGGSGPEG
ncbi:PH domain-containing protein [Ornithinimicrobium cryptoxanthini]|uniref:PH domain-containing protein n=1 Tax=Ornithinimicrobium cryptoxanthini TaxID=2934161 RepID=A0ABY4YN05_9MICO|nr:PH domain-containing protein [Ornithinimicrobium cryptoxanthini]USQ77718.1 PH domain-containing protein [Ornithinimicrobium cryptoxanthini]